MELPDSIVSSLRPTAFDSLYKIFISNKFNTLTSNLRGN